MQVNIVSRTGMSRYNAAVVGELIAANGREVEITRLRFDTDGEWWGGSLFFSWGSILHPGLCRLIMNNGANADIFVDELRGDGTGGELGFFRGYGPAPDWATQSRVG